MHQIRKGGFRRFAVVVAVAAAGILVVGAHAASAGTLEICKSGANGMAGKTFHFTVSPGGNPAGYNITPAGAGFTCTSVINTGAANTQATVTESDVNTVSEVASITVIPSIRKVSENLPAKQVVVNLGTSTANETQVRFVNQPPGGTSGVLKVCKLTQTPAFVGRSFSFSVGPTLANQGPLVSTPANDFFDDPSNWSCRILGTFQVGSNVFVKEQIPANVEIDFIDTDPGANLIDFNTDEGWAQVRIDSGTTLVLFDDEPIPPSGTGFIEICKNPPGFQDPAVTGSWHFTITDQDGNPVGPAGGVDVLTNQCSPSLLVPAGILTVTETARAGFQLTSIFTNPPDALVNSNLINRTADVEVATSSNPADETQVSFVNEAIRTQLKICKALGDNSSVLAGQTFNFRVTDITDPNNPVVLGTTTVVAPGCKIFRTLPIGTVVQVDEFFTADDPSTPLFDESGEFITNNSPQTTTIGAGTANTVTITNTAFGLLQVCKDAVPGITTQPTFQFRIDGGAIFTVQGNHCAPARRVSIGNHTVTELATANFELTAITVDPSGRQVGAVDLANRQVTVSVPYGTQGETVVTFTNRIKQARFKVCKTIRLESFDALNGDPFNFLLYIQTGGTHAAPVFAGSPTMLTLNASTNRNDLTVCSGFTAYFPIIQANGEKTIVGVQEQLTGGFAVDSITASPNNGLCVFGPGTAGGNDSPVCVPGGMDLTGTSSPGYATIDFFPSGANLGNIQVTFTNRAT